MSNAWKNAERAVAKKLGGTRVSRGANFSASLPDIQHEKFSIEVKYRKILPALWRDGLAQAATYSNKPPLLVIKERHKHGALVVLKLDDFCDLFGPLQRTQEEEV